jgi:hypothetical protein
MQVNEHSLLFLSFFLFPLTYSHTILARCPSANQLATTTSQKTKYESSQMSPEAYPGAI